MMRLSGFADEISQDLTEEVDVLQSEQIKFVELRSLDNKSLADFTAQEAVSLKQKLDDKGIGVSAFGSPIGKVDITEPFKVHLDKFKHIVELAAIFETNYIRIFSYYFPEGKSPQNYRDEVMSRMQQKVDVVNGTGITLLHENEARIYGEGPEACLDILETINSPVLRAIFDFANFVVTGYKPFDDCWKLLKNYTDYFHVKDAVLATKQITPAGEGDGDIGKILKDASLSGYDGFLSLEPHLQIAGANAGFSGSELFKKASQALKKVLATINVEYS